MSYPDAIGGSRSRSPPPPPREYPPPGERELEDRSGFSRGGFAPLPHRHSDLPPIPPPPTRFERDDYDRGRREFPRRDLDPEPEDRYERREWDDYSRGRGGSHWEDDYDRPKRRRSPSPLGPSHRPRHHSPSPPRYSLNLPDPASIETLLSFRHFAEWFRASHPQTAKADEEETRRHRELIESGTATEAEAKEKVGMAKRYERYRKEFLSRQLYALFLTHKDSIWFQERYSHLPEFVSFRRRLNRQGRVPLAEKHLDELRSGVWDTVEFDISEAEHKRTDKSRLNDHDEPEGLDRALGEGGSWVGDDTLRAEIAPKPKQVFVKTAPPTTSRKELEELFARIPGFQWLALSEPAQKKSFHRVAWAQYADDVDIGEVINKLDGQKIDGFTFHMSVNSTPTIGRLRVTPPVSNTLSRLLHDGQRAKALALKLEEELLGDDEDEDEKPETEGEVSVPKAENGEKKVPGLREKVSDIVEETIVRLLEVNGLVGENLDAERSIHKAKITLDQWLAYLRHGLATCYYCVAPMSFVEELHRKCIGHMRPHPSVKSEEVDVPTETNGGATSGAAADISAPEAEAEAEEDGQAEGGDEDRELRETEVPSSEQSKPANVDNNGSREQGKKQFFPQKTQDEKWAEGLENKIKPLLEDVDVIDYGGRDPEAETKKLCAPLIKQEEASKYRCKDCNKLFRAPEFVIKHILVKHPEVTKPKVDDILTLNNYVLDPQHLQPTLSTPAAVDDRLLSSIPGAGMNNPMMMAVNPALAPMSNQQMFDPSGNMGMMQQQMMMMMQMQQAMLMGNMNMMPNMNPTSTGGSGGGGREGNNLASRMGGYAGGREGGSDTLPPPPPGGEDPRARRGRVSYTDLDEPSAAGGGGLPY
ncbi:uncharacterized protein IL334_000269 [Kwoniella shivajii]|uniref:C2H2-type domain-containing protein n=1 Tax=Kwoniella shivajii TaxID=564305 RepID=A0ABZ1CQ61_9TREE|nr:hypothetical protein IL334_000269 [Kwoniella shivajii]